MQQQQHEHTLPVFQEIVKEIQRMKKRVTCLITLLVAVAYNKASKLVESAEFKSGG
jgi:hypothetical protein